VGPYRQHNSDADILQAYAYHPSLGINGVYVGGAYQFGAFRGQGPGRPAPFQDGYGNPTPAGNPTTSGGNFYVQRTADVRNPASLIHLASSRGADVTGTGMWGWGATLPDPNATNHIIRPGYWIVLPPRPHPTGRGSSGLTLGNGWNVTDGQTAGDTWNPKLKPSTWGMLDMRCNGKAITCQMDGSVKNQSLADLRDMRKWSNHASNANWNFNVADVR
jgi:hypothetical protein